MVWPTFRSRTAKDQNRSALLPHTSMPHIHSPIYACFYNSNTVISPGCFQQYDWDSVTDQGLCVWVRAWNTCTANILGHTCTANVLTGQLSKLTAKTAYMMTLQQSTYLFVHGAILISQRFIWCWLSFWDHFMNRLTGQQLATLVLKQSLRTALYNNICAVLYTRAVEPLFFNRVFNANFLCVVLLTGVGVMNVQMRWCVRSCVRNPSAAATSHAAADASRQGR